MSILENPWLIPVQKPTALSWEDANEIASKFGNPHILSNSGPLVRRLEFELGELLNVPPERVVVFSSATTAISAGLFALSLGGKVAIPDFSFIGTLRAAQAVSNIDLTVVDISPETWTLSPRKVNQKEVTYVPVSPFGESPEVIMKLFKGEKAVIDSAASLGAMPDCSSIETEHVICFSLHATKVLGAGEGGFAVFGDKAVALRARDWGAFGRGPEMRGAGGANAKMSEVQAAFCLAKLQQWESERRRWQASQVKALEISRKYSLNLAPSGFRSPNPYWVVDFEDAKLTARVEEVFASKLIETRRWWPHSLAEAFGLSGLPTAGKKRAETLGLPMFQDMTSDDFNRIDHALEVTFLGRAND